MEERGYATWKAEAWIPMGKFGGIRRDLFNIIDMLAIDATHTVGVQVCGGTGFSSHKKKLLEGEFTRLWLTSGNRRLYLQAWEKKNIIRGGTAKRYTLREEEITLDSLPPVSSQTTLLEE